MGRQKLKNLLLSLIVLALWTMFIVYLSARADPRATKISPLFVWMVLTYFFVLIAAGIFFVLRLFRIIDPERNFFYFLLATANLIPGLGGVFFYLGNKIPLEFLHYLLLNLLVGVIMMADIFFCNALFKTVKQ